MLDFSYVLLERCQLSGPAKSSTQSKTQLAHCCSAVSADKLSHDNQASGTINRTLSGLRNTQEFNVRTKLNSLTAASLSALLNVKKEEIFTRQSGERQSGERQYTTGSWHGRARWRSRAVSSVRADEQIVVSFPILRHRRVQFSWR